MKKKVQPSAKQSKLRNKAEEPYSIKVGDESGARKIIPEAEANRLIHELEVHQIELELQNQELTQAKENLKKAVDKYTHLYDFAPSGYLALSEDAKILEANLRSAQMLGKERSRIINNQFNFFVSDDTKPIFTQFLCDAFASQTKTSCIVTLSVKDEKPMFVHVLGRVIEDGDYCNLILVDITEQVLQEQAIRESEELHRITMENIHDPVFITDDFGRFTFICSNVKHSLGYSKNEISEIGNINKLIGESTFNSSKLKSSEGSLNIEKSLVSKDGLVKHYSITISKVNLQGGTLLFVFHDQSEQKHAFDLQQAHLRLIEYAADHDVQELLQKFLDEAEILTHSDIGFYHFVENDQETISLQT